jgi:hypothetical protein
MNAVNNDDANNQTNWPRRKGKKVKKTVQIRDAKVKGLEHIMYSNFKKTMLGHDNLTDFILYI